MIDEERLDYLIARFQQVNLTVDEETELTAWFDSYIEQDLYYPEEEKLVQSRMFVRLMEDSGYVSKLKRNRSIRFWYSIASTIAIFLVAGAVYYYSISEPRTLPVNRIVINGKADIKPGRNSAQLILEDGSIIDLDGEHGAIKMGDDIVYSDGSAVMGSTDELHRLSVKTPIVKLKTPKAGQYRVELSDGTVVWMNAETTLSYPKEFTADDTRQVELEGEAYFEVAHNSTKPFIIKTDKQAIQVVGTSFNVENYPDRRVSRTTLLTGSVKILTEQGDQILKPGQQIIVSSSGSEIRSVYTDDAIAWKNGRFIFYNERLDEVMDKISSWYDVPIEFGQEGIKAEKIFAAVSRYENISVVLAKIEATGVASFVIEKGRVQVVPYRKKNND